MSKMLVMLESSSKEMGSDFGRKERLARKSAVVSLARETSCMEVSSFGDIIFNKLFLEEAELGEEDLDEPARLVECSVKSDRLEKGNFEESFSCTVLSLWLTSGKGGTVVTVLLEPEAEERVDGTSFESLTVSTKSVTEPAESKLLSIIVAGAAGCEFDEPNKSEVVCSTGRIATPCLLDSD